MMFTCININHMCSFILIVLRTTADHAFFHVQDVTGENPGRLILSLHDSSYCVSSFLFYSYRCLVL
jgi:hypothetical protein